VRVGVLRVMCVVCGVVVCCVFACVVCRVECERARVGAEQDERGQRDPGIETRERKDERRDGEVKEEMER
jgi:hypothetical protein